MELQRFIPPAYLLEYVVTGGLTATGESTSINGEPTSVTGGPTTTGEPYKYLLPFVIVFNILFLLSKQCRKAMTLLTELELLSDFSQVRSSLLPLDGQEYSLQLIQTYVLHKLQC